jgi:hypothetical protein
LLQRLADYERRDIDAQKRRSGFADQVRPTPVGSIFAHEAIVVGTLRAFFRAANRRPAVQAAPALQGDGTAYPLPIDMVCRQ